MSDQIRLVYISTAAFAFTADQVRRLAHKSVTSNAKIGITGMLLYSAGHFMQCLEGNSAIVAGVYKRVSGDNRHREVTTLTVEPADERLFAQWSMGMLNLDDAGVAELDRSRLLQAVQKARRDRAAARSAAADAIALLKDFRLQLPAAA